MEPVVLRVVSVLSLIGGRLKHIDHAPSLAKRRSSTNVQGKVLMKLHLVESSNKIVRQGRAHLKGYKRGDYHGQQICFIDGTLWAMPGHQFGIASHNVSSPATPAHFLSASPHTVIYAESRPSCAASLSAAVNDEKSHRHQSHEILVVRGQAFLSLIIMATVLGFSRTMQAHQDQLWTPEWYTEALDLRDGMTDTTGIEHIQGGPPCRATRKTLLKADLGERAQLG
jgi:hypothetical protein